MELIPIIKQTLYIVTALFVVTVIVSYIASKFKKPKKEIPPPEIKPEIISAKRETKPSTKTTAKSKTKTTVSKTETSGSASKKVNPEKIKLPPNIVRKKSSRKKSKKKPEPNSREKAKRKDEPRFEVVTDLKKAGNKFKGKTDNNNIEFR